MLHHRSEGKNTLRQMEAQAKIQIPDSQTAHSPPDRGPRRVAVVLCRKPAWWEPEPCRGGMQAGPRWRARCRSDAATVLLLRAAFLWDTGKSTNSGFEVPGRGAGSQAVLSVS